MCLERLSRGSCSSRPCAEIFARHALTAELVSLLSDLLQHGWDVFLNYQQMALIAFVLAYPAASALIITPFLLLLFSWLAHRSPIAHLLTPRQAYLEGLLLSYGKAELPISSATSGLKLEAIFQPMTRWQRSSRWRQELRMIKEPNLLWLECKRPLL
jgi:hypothetical protein